MDRLALGVAGAAAGAAAPVDELEAAETPPDPEATMTSGSSKGPSRFRSSAVGTTRVGAPVASAPGVSRRCVG